LDPFAGSGTTLEAAQRSGRAWVGIDISALAIEVTKRRLDRIAPGSYAVFGQPDSIDSARAIAQVSPFEFESWALGLVGAEPVSGPSRREHDADGLLYFRDGGEPRARTIFVEVKAARVTVAALRPLETALGDGTADIAVLLSLDEPSSQLRERASKSGHYTSRTTGSTYPRLQVLSVAELLAGRTLDYPGATIGKIVPRGASGPPRAPAQPS
jgi:site-specific DNA-methyltransferase (adenine-specific)